MVILQPPLGLSVWWLLCCCCCCVEGACEGHLRDDNVEKYIQMIRYSGDPASLPAVAASKHHGPVPPTMYMIALVPSYAVVESKLFFGLVTAREEWLDLGCPGPNVSLGAVVVETQCNPGIAMRALFDLLHHLSTTAFVILGCGCPELTGQISQVSLYWNITMVSYEDTSPELANEHLYRNLIRLAPSEADANLPRLRLLRMFNWTKTGSLYQDLASNSSQRDQPMAAANANLNNILEARGANVTEAVSNRFVSFQSAVAALQRMKARKYRIISAFVSEATALASLLCAAHNTGMTGGKHVWLISGVRLLGGDTVVRTVPIGSGCTGASGGGSGCNCTKRQLLAAANGSLFIDLVSFFKGVASTKQSHNQSMADEMFLFAHAVDSVTAVAKAARALMLSGRPPESLRSLQLKRALMGMNFTGFTGTVSFAGSSRLGHLSLEQLLVSPNGNLSQIRERLRAVRRC